MNKYELTAKANKYMSLRDFLQSRLHISRKCVQFTKTELEKILKTKYETTKVKYL